MILHRPLKQIKRLKYLLSAAVIYITALHFSGPLYAQRFELDDNIKRESVNFINVKNLIIIPVFINGKGPYNFVLDTGVGQMIITDTTFLKDFDLSKFKTIKIQGYGFGKDISAILTRTLTAKVGRSTMKNIPAAIFKDDIFDLSSYLGVRVYGILGYHFFNSFVVKINYATQKLTFYNPLTTVKRKGTKIPIRIVNAKPYINAEITTAAQGKINVDLLVDNGSSHPLMLESLDGGPFPIPDVTIPANLGVGINGQINGYMGRVSQLKIQEFTFDDILSGFPDFKTERTNLEGVSRNGSLGADVLKHFLVTFDYPDQALYLKKSNNFKKKFDHDMSGIEIYVKQDLKERFFISRIEPGSPAEQAGLCEDDEILAIDFRNIDVYTLNDLTEMFRDQDGKHILVEVNRKGERFIVILKLKRRI